MEVTVTTNGIGIIRRKEIEDREERTRRVELNMLYTLMDRYPESAEKHFRRRETIAAKNILDNAK